MVRKEMLESLVDKNRSEFHSVIEDLKGYAARDLNKDNKEKRFVNLDKGFDTLLTLYNTLDREYTKLETLAKKITSVDNRMRKLQKEVGTEIATIVQREVEALSGRIGEMEGGMLDLNSRLKGIAKIVGSGETPACKAIKEDLSGFLTQVKQTVRDISVPRTDHYDESRGKSEWTDVVKRKRKVNRGPQTVLEADKDKAVTREDVAKCLDAKKGDVRVKGIRRQGKYFVVEVHSAEDLDKLKSNKCLEEIGLKVNGAPKLRSPRVIIYDVNRQIDKEDLLEAVHVRNRAVFGTMSEEEIKESFIPEYIAGRKDREFRAWVVRITPSLFERLTKDGGVYVGLRRCRVAEFIGVTRCFKCQGLGRTQKYCTNKLTCSRCGRTGHHAMRCRSEVAKCTNCKKLGLKENRHPATWMGCPSLWLYKSKVKRLTDYNG